MQSAKRTPVNFALQSKTRPTRHEEVVVEQTGSFVLLKGTASELALSGLEWVP
jgi:hypothetical protein